MRWIQNGIEWGAKLANILAILPAGYCAYGTYVLLHPNLAATPSTSLGGPSMVNSTGVLFSLCAAFACVAIGAILNVAGYKQKNRISANPTPAPVRTYSSKLVIHTATYQAVYGGGDVYDVTECLKGMTIGDGMALDIENHNFVVGDRNFVPRDPKSGVRKRLRVEYSFGNATRHVIERFEHRRLVLPEEEFGLHSDVQAEALVISKRLRDFSKEMGPRPDADWNSGDKSDPDWMARKIGQRRAVVDPWLSRLKHRFAQEFLADVNEVTHYLGAAGLNTSDLSLLSGNMQTESDLMKLEEILDSLAIELNRLPQPLDQDGDTISKYESLSTETMRRFLQSFADAGKAVDEAYARKNRVPGAPGPDFRLWDSRAPFGTKAAPVALPVPERRPGGTTGS